MNKSTPRWRAFEDLVHRILEANNFDVRPHYPRGDAGFDFIGILEGEKWAIEVKYYRTARAQPSLIEAAASRVVNNGIIANAMKGMLVVSCLLPAALRIAFQEKFSLTFVDGADLKDWASVAPQLVEELDSLLEVDPAFTEGALSTRGDLSERSRPLAGMAVPAKDARGSELCEELKKIRRGKAAWNEYEQVCEKVLRYLFPNDLSGWHAQKRTDDGLSRFDFVCRVRPKTEFWKFLIDHLNSRYVLFEFKNYTGKITQGQILTTEKYLLERGLRSVAIVLTRAGAEPSAIKMTQGAMREHGKLMLVVNDEKLCQMLHMRERGEDPTDCLFELADDFLLSLPR